MLVSYKGPLGPCPGGDFLPCVRSGGSSYLVKSVFSGRHMPNRLYRPMIDLKLLPFQRRFVAAAMRDGIRTAALSIPRGGGKSTLAGIMASDALKAAKPHEEIALVAASLEQGRIVFKVVRRLLGETGYRYLDSTTKVGITAPNGAKLRVLASSGRTAMGLMSVPLVIADEPGAWQVRDGELLWDAITTAMGKPDSSLRCVLIGTLAPMGQPGHWWHELVAGGSGGSTYVQALQGDPEKWDQWPEIRKANPLMGTFAESRAVLLEERDAARRDSRLKSRFLSYRLNVPSSDESTMLLTVPDWKLLTQRDVPPRSGRPIVGIDLGGGRAWSAAVAVWESGRVECLALAPGIPSISDQEKRDHVPAGLYQKLVETGALRIASGKRVPAVSQLVDAVRENFGLPANFICDRFRLGELRDAAGSGAQIVARVTRWSEASADIRALRKFAVDGPFSVAETSRPLLAASLAAALVKSDDQGSVRLVKRGSNNTARDDAAQALVLASGSFERSTPGRGARPRRRLHVV